jgi:hypothetical protein
MLTERHSYVALSRACSRPLLQPPSGALTSPFAQRADSRGSTRVHCEKSSQTSRHRVNRRYRYHHCRCLRHKPSQSPVWRSKRQSGMHASHKLPGSSSFSKVDDETDTRSKELVCRVHFLYERFDRLDEKLKMERAYSERLDHIEREPIPDFGPRMRPSRPTIGSPLARLYLERR